MTTNNSDSGGAGADRKVIQNDLGMVEVFDQKIEDNDYLGASPVGRCLMGSVYEVNGEGAEECKEYLPTRFELELLAKHWANVDLDFRLDGVLVGLVGSDGLRRQPFARRRLARIGQAIGEEAVEGIVKKVEAEAKKQVGDEYWRVFTEGTEEEIERVQNEINGTPGRS